jgi:tetratricopeptide (TPR) repeat protein
MSLLRILILSIPIAVFAQTPLTPEQRGDLYMARKMYREAIDSYRASAGNSAVMWDKIGIGYHQLGNLPAAQKAYEHAIKIDKKYADAINNVGTVFYAEKKYRSAISRYNRALQFAPDSASIWSNLGTAWYARGKYDLMNQAYTKALQLDPEVFERRASFGVMLQEHSVADRAKFHYYLAKTYAKEGMADRALLCIRKSIEEGFADRRKYLEEPEFAGLRNNREFMEIMESEPKVL